MIEVVEPEEGEEEEEEECKVPDLCGSSDTA
jgi:hypothetical protein